MTALMMKIMTITFQVLTLFESHEHVLGSGRKSPHILNYLILPKMLFGIHEGKNPLGRPGHRCEYSIEVHLQEIECGVVNWIHLA
jgi:hypothetical protein